MVATFSFVISPSSFSCVASGDAKRFSIVLLGLQDFDRFELVSHCSEVF